MTIINSSTANGVLSSRGILRTRILLSLFIFAPTLASAATYYVAPSGSNSSPGTQAQPFATLQKAHDAAFARDTIYMRGGTYRFSVQTTFTRDGTSGNPIKVFNYPGETPVIDAINLPSGNDVIRMTSASWWHIKGLELKNGAREGIYAEGSSSNNIFEGNNIHHMGRLASGGGRGTAIAIYGTGGNNLVLNNDAHDNDDALSFGGGANGIAIVTTGTGNIVRGNRAWRNSDDGIDMWNAAPALLENNWVWESGYTWNGSVLVSRGNGNGFKLGGKGAGDGGHTLKNNVAWKNKTHGFHDNSGDLPMTLYNNTAWDNGGTTHFNYDFGNPSNIFRNNISYGTRGAISGSATHNSWNNPSGGTVTSEDFASLDDTCARGPRQANGSLPNCPFLHLASNSHLINKGTNGGLPYSGSGPDLGAFEYGGTGPDSTCTQTPLNVSAAKSDGDFAYIVVASFGTPADNSANLTRSVLKLFENSLELGPAHSPHANIRNLGQGRFSHWSQTTGTGEALRFAGSNNTDPRTNGRSYTYCVPGTTSSGFSNEASTTIASTTAPTANFSVDVRGKQKKLYCYERMMTPYEKLKSLPNPERFLKPGLTPTSCSFIGHYSVFKDQYFVSKYSN